MGASSPAGEAALQCQLSRVPLTLPAPAATQIHPSHQTPLHCHCLSKLQPPAHLWNLGLWSSGQKPLHGTEQERSRSSSRGWSPSPQWMPEGSKDHAFGAGECNYCLKKRFSYLKQGCFKLTLEVKVSIKPSRTS